MSHYVVWARPLNNLDELRDHLDNIDRARAFSGKLRQSLLNARFDPDGWVALETDFHLNTAFTQERAMLEAYFTDFTTDIVEDSSPVWNGIHTLPPLWGAGSSAALS